MWLLPSKGRPASLKRFFEAFRATGGSTPGLVLVGRADYEEHRAAYNAIAADLPPGWFLKVTELESQGDKVREVWDEVRDCAWLGLIGDDCVPETLGWDRWLTAALAEASIVSCNDGWQAPCRVANCWIVAGEMLRAIGYFFPPGLHHLFIDDLWEAIGGATGRRCLMDVMVRHRHVMRGEAPRDATHRAAYGDGFTAAQPGPDRAHGLWAHDEAVFAAWRAAEMPRAIAAAATVARNLAPLATVAAAPGVGHTLTEAERVAARQARIRGRRVMICTPTHRSMAWQFTKAYAETWLTLAQYGAAIQGHFVAGSSNLPRARSELARAFLASDCDDMVFIDADMGWNPNAVVRLIASDKEIVAAIGRKRVDLDDPKDLAGWCVRLLPGPDLVHDHDMGMIEVEAVGTGMMKISRSALEQIRDARPDLQRPDYTRFFWFNEQDGGEDYEFCRLARSLGLSIWVDPLIELTHVGDKEYTGKFADLITFGPGLVHEAEAPREAAE
jgi:hypothetical protein